MRDPAPRWVGLLVLAILSISGLEAVSAASLSLGSQALTAYRTCTVTATPSSTTGVIDATLRQSAPTTNTGTTTTFVVSSSNGANQRTYVWFDLSRCSPAIPASATVRLATLRAYVSGLASLCRTIDIFRVTASWTETGITWNNQPFGTSINNPASTARTDSFDAGTPASCENRTTGTYITGAVVTADVATFVAGTATNFGWMLRDDSEGSGTARTTTWSSKEAAVVAQAPQLVVTYVTVP